MPNYTVSFKNGHKMKIDVVDGARFTTALLKGYNTNPSSTQQIYSEEGLIINVTDISACHLSSLDSEES